MNCKLTDASTQQGGRQTFRESLRLINHVRRENLLTTHRLSALYFPPPIVIYRQLLDVYSKNFSGYTGRREMEN